MTQRLQFSGRYQGRNEGLHNPQRARRLLVVTVGRGRRGEIDPDRNVAKTGALSVEEFLVDGVEGGEVICELLSMCYGRCSP